MTFWQLPNKCKCVYEYEKFDHDKVNGIIVTCIMFSSYVYAPLLFICSLSIHERTVTCDLYGLCTLCTWEIKETFHTNIQHKLKCFSALFASKIFSTCKIYSFIFVTRDALVRTSLFTFMDKIKAYESYDTTLMTIKKKKKKKKRINSCVDKIFIIQRSILSAILQGVLDWTFHSFFFV